MWYRQVIVLDTNVIYSALRSRRGSSYRLLEVIVDKDVEFAISAALIFEYEDVLKRSGAGLPYTEAELDEILDSLIALGRAFSPHFLWRPYLRNAKDDMILELAVASNAKEIITFNVRDFKGCEKFGVKAVQPLKYLRKEKLL